VSPPALAERALGRLPAASPGLAGAFEPFPDRIGRSEAVTYLPGDPPRNGRIVVYERAPRSPASRSASALTTIEVVLASAGGSGGVRRRVVPARSWPIMALIEALPKLLSEPETGLEPAHELDECGLAAWLAVVNAGLGIVARGRLYPTVSPAGFDAWRAGPLDPSDRRLVSALGAAFPPPAHALALPGVSPLSLRSPEALIVAAWDAIADTLPRTAAAALLAPRDRGEPDGRQHPGVSRLPPVCFASLEPQPAEHLRTWSAEAGAGIAGSSGADVALRIELADVAAEPLAPPGVASGGPINSSIAGRGVLQLTSRAETSLVVDAADLFEAPAAVLARFGQDAEIDLLRALRRASRAWPPMEALLHERAPTAIVLDEERLAELLGDATAALASTGVEVLWPTELVAGGIKLRASLIETPGVVTRAGFGLDELVQFSWQATLDGALLSSEEIDQLAEAKRGLVRLRGRWVSVDSELLERLRAGHRERLTAGEALAALLTGTILLDGEPTEVVASGPLAALATRLGALRDAPAELSLPSGLADGVELRPYQRRGVAWLAAMVELGLGGCLADDMGLGKTLQVIALHLHRAAAGQGPTLVVCPTSLLGNWEREVHRFAPEVPVRRYHGAGRNLDQLAADELVVTSYGVTRLDAAQLGARGFALVVADEVQAAKNPSTATAKALRQLAAPARLGLTGTPVENRLSDLWAILDWTTPGLLGPLERFVRGVATPIERYRDPVVTERLVRTIAPFVLRRKKSDPEVAPDLPERIVSDVPVPLTSEQTTLYEAEVREALDVIATKDGIARQALVLRLLTVLKQICNHPAQYLHQPGPLAGRSGKLTALEELLEVITAEGESVLVFSQFVECLQLIDARLAELGTATLFLHGKVPARRRAELVDAFQQGSAPVLLCSLKVGGVGLNLTRATHVVHYDRWWNPASEDQATDRAHRIGQQHTVQVHRLVAEGTLEDRIAELIQSKRALAKAVVGAGEAWLGRLSDDDLAELVELSSGR
jgi:superfamily II DNA or RNA helicase